MDMREYASLDFEGASQADLKKVGAAVYSEHATTRILCGSFYVPGFGAGNWRYDQKVPEVLLDWVADGKKLSAWNATFEYLIWNNVLAFCPFQLIPDLKWEQTYDTMAQAAYWGLPLSLDQAAQALPQLGISKDMEGHSLMLSMSKPRKKKGSTGWWHTDVGTEEKQRFDRLMVYCDGDVKTERAIAEYLPPLPDKEREVWLMDARANNRGMTYDRHLGADIKYLAQIELDRLGLDLEALTMGEVTSVNQVTKINKWCQDRDPRIDGLAKDKLATYLSWHDLPNTVHQVLAIRQEAAKSSIAKVDAMSRWAGGNSDQMRGLTQYYGAFRTGRWAGRGPQIQNYFRSMVKDQVRLVSGIKSPNSEKFLQDYKTIYGPQGLSILECLASALRGCITHLPNDECFASIDFKQIEARVLAWLAGETALIQTFFDDKDVYVTAAAGIYRKPEDEVNASERQVGKVSVLACLAGDTRVLVKTKQGLVTDKPLSRVGITDLVWDGDAWVAHGGLIDKGARECLELNGTKLTPDHLIWCGPSTGWMQAGRVASSAKLRSRMLDAGSASLPSQGICWEPGTALKPSSCNVIADDRNTVLPSTTSWRDARCAATPVPKRLLRKPARKNTSTTPGPVLTSNTAAGCSIVSQQSRTAATAQTTRSGWRMGEEASSVGGGRNTGTNAWAAYHVPDGFLPSSGDTKCLPIFSRLMGGTFRNSSWTGSTTMGTTHRGTSGSVPGRSIHGTSDPRTTCPSAFSNSKPKMPVYDLLNAGPRNRFTVLTDAGPVIVHNCGYQGGVGAFQSMAKVYGLNIPDDQAEQIKTAYRAAHKRIVRLWYDVDRRALACVRTGQSQSFQIYENGPTLSFRMWKGNLCVQLPSGRVLTYRDAELGTGAFGNDCVTYMGVDQYTRKWTRIDTYGGKFVENFVQAIARDVMAEAMLRVEGISGVSILGSVHDEILMSLYRQHLYDDALNEMKLVPHWAHGMPIDADGYTGTRFRKD